jgi:hypothetical protein
MKAFGGSKGVAPLILSLGSRGRWVIDLTPFYPPGKETLVHTEQEAGWAEDPVWLFWGR